MTPQTIFIRSTGTESQHTLQQRLPSVWHNAPLTVHLALAGPDDTSDSIPTGANYYLSILATDANKLPTGTALIAATTSLETGSAANSRGPHAIWDLGVGDMSLIEEPGDYWLLLEVGIGGGDRVVRAAGRLTIKASGLQSSPASPTDPNDIFLTTLDMSEGGNGVADDGKVSAFAADGSLTATVSVGVVGGSGRANFKATNVTATRNLEAPDSSGTLATQEWTTTTLGSYALATAIRGKAWVSGYSYTLGDIVSYDEDAYVATSTHTASGANRPDQVSAPWERLVTATLLTSELAGKADLAGATFTGAVVFSDTLSQSGWTGNAIMATDSEGYAVTTGLTDPGGSGTVATVEYVDSEISTIEGNYAELTALRGNAWVSGYTYVAGDVVTRANVVYTAIGGHVAGASNEPGVGASWATQWTKHASVSYVDTALRGKAWAAGVSYTDGDIVSYDDNAYVATSTHTSSLLNRPDQISAPWSKHVTEAYVDNNLALKASLSGATFTGTITGSVVQASGSGGFSFRTSSGSDTLILGAGGGINATAYGTWNFDGATANTIASFGASKTLSSLSTSTYPSLTELSYVKGVTSAVQTQLNAKEPYGLVKLVSDTGAVTAYNPASDTDAARGTALFNACSAATAGQTVRVSAGAYALSGATVRLALADNVNLEMEDGVVITSDADLLTDGCVIYPGNNSVIRGGKIVCSGSSSQYAAAIGVVGDIFDDVRTGVQVIGVTMVGDTDCFYIQEDTGNCTAVLRDCTLISKWDNIVATSLSSGAAHEVDVYNCRQIVTGPSATGSNQARGVMATFDSVIRVYGGNVECVNGGTSINAGVYAKDGGTIEVHDVTFNCSNSVNPNYDLQIGTGGGTIKVSGGSGSGTAGGYLTSGTINYLDGKIGSTSGLLKANGSGTVSAAAAGTDYLTPSGNGSSLTALNATQLTSGTIPDARFPATLPAASGANLTALNAANVSSGLLPDARLYALYPSSLAGTYDDDFSAGSLAGKWSLQGAVGGDFTYQTRGGGWTSWDAGTSTGIRRLIYQAWTATTNATITVRIAYNQLGGGHPMWGPMFTDGSGNGIACTWYSNSTSFGLATLSSYAYSAFPTLSTQGTMHPNNQATLGPGLWLKLTKTGTTYTAQYSLDGQSWSAAISATNGTTMTRVGIGLFDRIAGVSATTASSLSIDFFKVE